ncbi:MAG: hypothetical protein RLO50_14640 [Azospirillaceae bacterium]
MTVCVCLLVHGSRDYFAVADEAISSILDHSRFDIFAALGTEGRLRSRSSRLHRKALDTAKSGTGRPYRFLLKFNALQRCLEEMSHDHIILMDADVVLTTDLAEADLETVLGEAAIGMVVQPRVRGGQTGPAELYDHYLRHAHALIVPDRAAPDTESFRYFNSGVVVARREALMQLVDWALSDIAAKRGRHEFGGHMVADQDYFQVWANVLRPWECGELPWSWNHCEHWDDGFPRDGTVFAHFSNFCNGPAATTGRRMRTLRRADDGRLWPFAAWLGRIRAVR